MNAVARKKKAKKEREEELANGEPKPKNKSERNKPSAITKSRRRLFLEPGG